MELTLLGTGCPSVDYRRFGPSNLISTKKTKILIAHRLSTVKRCDKIFLFDKGELKHEGNYQDLIKNSDKFRLSAKNS